MTGLSAGLDVGSTRAIIEALGATVTEATARSWSRAASCTSRTRVLDVGNSGTGIRLLAGLLAGLPFLSVLQGDESIGSRDRWTGSPSRCG